LNAIQGKSEKTAFVPEIINLNNDSTEFILLIWFGTLFD